MATAQNSTYRVAMQASTKTKRLAVVVYGTVQGVGFRPFVHALAKSHQLTGFVRNSNGAVEIEVQGNEISLEEFVRELQDKAPPLSDLAKIDVDELMPRSEIGFSIEKSVSEGNGALLIGADSATCRDCQQELFDERDRRYRYPFINCTNCGPRFTIVESLPYDRHRTTMRNFEMCPKCAAEYNDAQNRRFHAQPNACAECGPKLTFKDSSQTIVGESALQMTLSAINLGQVIAIKGLGGFHLVCDAQNSSAIRVLRQRKNRRFKPLALMMSDIEMVRRYCEVSQAEEDALTSADQPIVLLRRRKHCAIPDEVSPGSDMLGVMLAYTPLHHLLLHDFGRPLIATSGNKRNEPIAINNDEARLRLQGLADAWLENDRDIHFRFDDSIVQLVDDEKLVMRRARGIAPHPIPIAPASSVTVLAVGGHLKNTFCLLHEGLAYMSQHIGDLECIESQEHFETTLSKIQSLFNLRPKIIACDLHPDYLSTSMARSTAASSNLPLFYVQHHHAHAVACMVEHGLEEDVIAVVFDGSGLGTDETIWGGEFLLANLRDFKRLAHFKPVSMPGGISAIKNSWRMALGYIFTDDSLETREKFHPFIKHIEATFGASVTQTLAKQVKAGINSPYTSSCGRLFDACSSLLGVRDQNEYEGQCAIELEVLARRYMENNEVAAELLATYPIEIGSELPIAINPLPILFGVMEDLQHGVSTEEISARFHATIARIIARVGERLRDHLKVNDVCLSGGVFQNRILLSFTKQFLRKKGFNVFYPRKVPANDGGLALGQAVVAAANIEEVPM